MVKRALTLAAAVVMLVPALAGAQADRLGASFKIAVPTTPLVRMPDVDRDSVNGVYLAVSGAGTIRGIFLNNAGVAVSAAFTIRHADEIRCRCPRDLQPRTAGIHRHVARGGHRDDEREQRQGAAREVSGSDPWGPRRWFRRLAPSGNTVRTRVRVPASSSRPGFQSTRRARRPRPTTTTSTPGGSDRAARRSVPSFQSVRLRTTNASLSSATTRPRTRTFVAWAGYNDGGKCTYVRGRTNPGRLGCARAARAISEGELDVSAVARAQHVEQPIFADVVPDRRRRQGCLRFTHQPQWRRSHGARRSQHEVRVPTTATTSITTRSVAPTSPSVMA